jgi:hypothetical protein
MLWLEWWPTIAVRRFVVLLRYLLLWVQSALSRTVIVSSSPLLPFVLLLLLLPPPLPLPPHGCNHY